MTAEQAIYLAIWLYTHGLLLPFALIAGLALFSIGKVWHDHRES